MRPHYKVKAHACHHSVPCLGYSFSETRKKLKHEYIDLSNREIELLVRKGETVVDECEIPLFVFNGDTTTRVFKDNPELFNFPVRQREIIIHPQPW